MQRGPLSPKRLLPFIIMVLCVFALAPSSVTGWVENARVPLEFVLRPVAHPVRQLAAKAAPAERPSDPRIADLQERVDQELLLRAQAEQRVERLRAMVADLQAGLTIAPDAPARSVWASIVGVSPDPREGIIIAGRGDTDGVLAGQTVAVARGVHLVGRVVSVSARSSRVIPITHPRAGLINAMVMTDDPTSGFAAQLIAEGDGTLSGELVASAEGVEVGQTVRLADDAWPASSQMVVIGRVTGVGHKDNQRITVAVRPDFDVARVSEVVLRIPTDPAGAPSAGGGAP